MGEKCNSCKRYPACQMPQTMFARCSSQNIALNMLMLMRMLKQCFDVHESERIEGKLHIAVQCSVVHKFRIKGSRNFGVYRLELQVVSIQYIHLNLLIRLQFATEPCIAVNLKLVLVLHCNFSARTVGCQTLHCCHARYYNYSSLYKLPGYQIYGVIPPFVIFVEIWNCIHL